MSHKVWLDNEYDLWAKALRESTVHNFKEHPQVRRMLSLDLERGTFRGLTSAPNDNTVAIDNIGREAFSWAISGSGLRMLYYAEKVLARNPKRIVEIGGGVGQFYAMLRAIGYDGDYFIMDLPEVQLFQWKYLKEVTRQTGLCLPLVQHEEYDFCLSLYALGEFDDATKNFYVEGVVKNCAHGMIVWNPHSGASSEVPFDCVVSDEYPATYLVPGVIKQLEW